MNINAIARGLVINFILDIILIFFLIHYGFDMSSEVFTSSLILILLFVAGYTGVSSERFGQLNGSLVGLFSSFILFAFLSQTTDMNWELNIWISSVWIVVGYIGGLIGNKLLKNNKKEKNVPKDKIDKKENEAI